MNRKELKYKYINEYATEFCNDLIANKKSNEIKFKELKKKVKKDNMYNELNDYDKENLIDDIEDFVENYNNFIYLIHNRKYIKNNTEIDDVVTEIKNEDNYTTTNKAILIKKMSDSEHKRITDIYHWIFHKNETAPAQRTEPWYRIRDESVTASDTGTVVGQNPYQKQYEFIYKKVFGSVFETNAACYHGKKFENAVTMMYEHINKVHVREFGLLSSDTVGILAASPDGICDPYYKGKPSHYAGRMIEIKCPPRRQIHHFGPIKGTICPIYYYFQIQQQLHCCNLDECDFVQCKIHSYENKIDYLLDTHCEHDYYSKKHDKLRGVVIQILPVKYDVKNYQSGIVSEEDIFNYADFIYPPTLEMSILEIEQWIENEKIQLEKNENYVFHKVYYWYCSEMLTTLIEREKDWIATNLEQINNIWKYVLFLRKNANIALEFKKIVDETKIKYNAKILKKLDELIDEHNNKIKNDSNETNETNETKNETNKTNATNETQNETNSTNETDETTNKSDETTNKSDETTNKSDKTKNTSKINKTKKIKEKI